MNRLKRMWVWLMRCHYTRGFGVQSPSAYRFIRYVINEHYPYYAYDELAHLLSEGDAVTAKLARLYFRLANFCQAECWTLAVENAEVKGEYVVAGCRKTNIADCVDGYELDVIAKADVCVMTLESHWQRMFDAFAADARANSMLVVEDIYASKEARRIWKKIIRDNRTVVTYDLYYCGIVFFDRSMHKQHYVVNF